MELKRIASLVDVVVAAIVVFVIVLPPRAVQTRPATYGDDDARLGMQFAAARVMAKPDDGALVADLSRRLADVGFSDWSVQEATAGSARMPGSPTRWHALLAAATAHAYRLEAEDALAYAEKAEAVCDALVEQCERDHACAPDGRPWCPAEDQARLDEYRRHLDAGVKSGIDPRKDPEKFRQAGEAALRRVHTGGPAPRP